MRSLYPIFHLFCPEFALAYAFRSGPPTHGLRLEFILTPNCPYPAFLLTKNLPPPRPTGSLQFLSDLLSPSVPPKSPLPNCPLFRQAPSHSPHNPSRMVWLRDSMSFWPFESETLPPPSVGGWKLDHLCHSLNFIFASSPFLLTPLYLVSPNGFVSSARTPPPYFPLVGTSQFP